MNQSEQIAVTATSGEVLNNKYVQDYYDEQVSSLGSSYTESRWFSSVVRTFEYNQTKRALEQALNSVGKFKAAVEIGPGDAVWTPLIAARVSERLHLVEQSKAMHDQAKEKLSALPVTTTIEHGDFDTSNPPKDNDLVIAIRCFEYFDSKPQSLKKMHSLLNPGGKLIIVTKNTDMYTTKGVQDRVVHSGQLKKTEVVKMLSDAGFTLNSVYPATFRFKAQYKAMRVMFDIIHKLVVKSSGKLVVPVLDKYASESYIYVATRPE